MASCRSYLDFRDFRNNLRLVKSVTAYRGYLFSVGEAPYVKIWLGYGLSRLVNVRFPRLLAA
jgi:hypothetical protein